ncbi:OLC1v1031462C1 [Oldenlandia corymbosa var. corymbosa]|uniref:OLC1v1031462C1 n=1 Tax=Oldenlandia corymbosa var. corymbosa TaxID=529605 RepID=A0AAV1CKB2_OLDCO|nr:OLC1v1031462C1 [Oldenlandia corymbosa var. corymbosa]
MEFLDEDARPRFVLQSKPTPEPAQSLPDSQALRKPTLFLSLSISSVLFALAVFYFTSEPFRSILIWFSLSLLVGPFAPPELTAGDIRVGLGPAIPEPVVETEISDDNSKRNSRRSAKSTRQPDGPVYGSGSSVSGDVLDGVGKNGIPANGNGSVVKFEKSVGKVVNEEVDWDEADEELLKKLMGKHPVGKPGRWEAIAQGFNGRHCVESVIQRSKKLGEKKVSDEDSYKKFLKDRKAVDKRVQEENDSNVVGGSGNSDVKGESSGWTPGDDLALLNALKAFPKDVAMRWEKIAAAVPGKTKAGCMKRVSELKKDFRSSKAAPSEA